jgi:4'-phosphopantetheinyl transferase EntD
VLSPLPSFSDDDVIVAVAAIGDVDTDSALSAERALVTKAVPQRQHEFLAGRVLARQLARQLGVTLPAVLMGRWRQPLWPNALTGSIAHSNGTIAVALRRGSEPLGIDIEDARALSGDEVALIAHANDADHINLDDPHRRAQLLSAKECVVKALQHNGFIELSTIELCSVHLDRWTLRHEQRTLLVRTVVENEVVWSTTVRPNN